MRVIYKTRVQINLLGFLYSPFHDIWYGCLATVPFISFFIPSFCALRNKLDHFFSCPEHKLKLPEVCKSTEIRGYTRCNGHYQEAKLYFTDRSSERSYSIIKFIDYHSFPESRTPRLRTALSLTHF